MHKLRLVCCVETNSWSKFLSDASASAVDLIRRPTSASRRCISITGWIKFRTTRIKDLYLEEISEMWEDISFDKECHRSVFESQLLPVPVPVVQLLHQ